MNSVRVYEALDMKRKHVPFRVHVESIGHALIQEAYDLQHAWAKKRGKKVCAQQPVLTFVIFMIILRQTFGYDQDVVIQHLGTFSSKKLYIGEMYMKGKAKLVPQKRSDVYIYISRRFRGTNLTFPFT